MESFRTYLNRDEKPLIIFDGGTGTSFQNLNLLQMTLEEKN